MEGEGKDFGEWMGLKAVVACEGDDCIAGYEFAEDLAAGSAGRAGGSVQICNCYSCDSWRCSSFTDGTEERVAFGAACQAVGGIFYIAAGEDGAVVEEQSCAYSEF